MKPIRHAVIAGLMLLGPAVLFAQSESSAKAAAAKADWTNLQATVNQALIPPRGAGANIFTQHRSALLAAAAACQAHAGRHATDVSAKDARCLEAMLLTRAYMAGDASRQERREQLVKDLRNDQKVTPALRAELIALVDTVATAKTPNLSVDELLARQERTARALIDEFADLPIGYLSLLAVARDSTETRAATIARDIVNLPGSPSIVREAAQEIADRVALVGQSFQAAAKTAAPETVVGSRGNALVIYTWTANDFVAFGRAKTAALKAPKGTTVLGVCLDEDPVAAQAAAKANEIPGVQVYDPLGRKSALATALKLSDSGMVYLVDSAGLIRSVTAHRQLNSAALFAGL